MIKLLLALFLLGASLHASVYTDFKRHLDNENYMKACLSGKKIFSKNERDEKLLSAIGQACLKADYIYVSTMVQSRLRTSKDSRINAVVFASTLLQKRLIYQFMYDDTDISTLGLPVTDHPLSHTFVAIRDKSYTLISASPKMITFKKDSKSYKVYIDFQAKGRIIIEETNKDNQTTTHRYL